jgi:hypothetical protein
MEIQVLNGQSLFDVAIQAAGSVEAAFAIAAANGVGITDELPAGLRLVVPAVANRQVADYYRVNGIVPATGHPLPFDTTGVEFWAVEYDFIVN